MAEIIPPSPSYTPLLGLYFCYFVLTALGIHYSSKSSLVVTLRLSCPRHVGSQFPDQGSNPCPLHWKADSQPLDHQGNPKNCFLWRRDVLDYGQSWTLVYKSQAKSGHNNFSPSCMHIPSQRGLAVFHHQELKPVYLEPESDSVVCAEGQHSSLGFKTSCSFCYCLWIMLLPWGEPGLVFQRIADCRKRPLTPLTHQQTQTRPGELSG